MTWPATPYVVTGPDLNREIRDNLLAVHPALVSVSLNTTLVTSNGHNVVVLMDATGGSRTVGLYTAVDNLGALVTVRKADASANAVVIDPAGSEEVEGYSTLSLTSGGEVVVLFSDNGNWRILSWRRTPVTTTISGTYVATPGDDYIQIAGGTFTLTLHPAATPRFGRPLTIKSRGTGLVTVVGDAGEALDAETSIGLYQDESLTVVPNAWTGGTAWLIV